MRSVAASQDSMLQAKNIGVSRINIWPMVTLSVWMESHWHMIILFVHHVQKDTTAGDTLIHPCIPYICMLDLVFVQLVGVENIWSNNVLHHLTLYVGNALGVMNLTVIR